MPNLPTIPGYEVIEKIGEGGMGEVYLARQVSLNRKVALKCLRPYSATDAGERDQRFKQEAFLMGKLSHPHIITIIDRGTANGQDYLVMEYIPSGTLRGLMKPGIPLPTEQARGILQAIAQALSYLHEQGILHQDLKPENVLLDPKGQVKVSDFGIAVPISELSTRAESSTVAGTVEYMAPEQLHRLGVDERADQYALAVLAYEMLTGRKPLGLFKNPSVLNRRLHPEVDAAILRGMEHDPDDRFHSILSFHQALDQTLLRASPKVEARLALLLSLLMLVGFAFIFLEFWLGRGEKTKTNDTPEDFLTGNGKEIPEGTPRGEQPEESRALERLRSDIEAQALAGPDDPRAASLRKQAAALMRQYRGTEKAIEAAHLAARLPWPIDALSGKVEAPKSFFARHPSVVKQVPEGLLAVLGNPALKHWNTVQALAFRNDGKEMATAGADETVKIWDLSTGQLKRELQALNGKPLCVAYSRDGKFLATGSQNKSIQVWNAETAEEIRTLKGHQDEILTLDFSPNSLLLASAGKDRTIRIWNLQSEAPEQVFTGHSGEIHCVQFSSDSRKFVSGSADQTVKIWDIESGRPTATFQDHAGAVYSVAWAEGGEILASGGQDNRVVLRHLSTKKKEVLRGHGDQVRRLAFSPDGHWLFSAGNDRKVMRWNALSPFARDQKPDLIAEHSKAVLQLGYCPQVNLLYSATADPLVQVLTTATLKKSRSLIAAIESSVHALAYSPDGKRLASGDAQGIVTLWLFPEEQSESPSFQQFQGPRGPIRSLDFSAEGKVLAVIGQENHIYLWDIQAEKIVLQFKGHEKKVLTLAFSPQGNLLASGGEDHKVILWDPTRGALLKTLEGHRGGVWSVAFSPDGKTLASGSEDNQVIFWDIPQGEKKKTITHPQEIFSLAFSPDRRLFAFADRDGTIKIREAETEKTLPYSPKHSNKVFQIRFSRDSSILASASEDSTVICGSPSLGKTLDILPFDKEKPFAIDFHPNGETLAVSGTGGEISLWDIKPLAQAKEFNERIRDPGTGQCLALCPEGLTLAYGLEDHRIGFLDLVSGLTSSSSQGHRDRIDCLAYRADGEWLASAGRDHKIFLWDPAKKKIIRTLEGHTGRVSSLAFHPSGMVLASRSDDRTVRLWDLEDGTTKQVLRADSDEIVSLSFSLDGESLISGGQQGTIGIWRWSTAEQKIRIHSGQKGITSLALSPDGRLIASGSSDKTIKIWEAGTLKLRHTLVEHLGSITSLAFSPDGEFLASAAKDGKVLVWKWKKAKLSRTIPLGPARGGVVEQVSFSPEGRHLACSNGNGTIYVLNLKP